MTHRIIILLFVALTTLGCGTHFVCKDAPDLQLRPTAPHSVKSTCGGDTVYTQEGPGALKFMVVCPAGRDPAYTALGEVTCRAR